MTGGNADAGEGGGNSTEGGGGVGGGDRGSGEKEGGREPVKIVKGINNNEIGTDGKVIKQCPGKCI